VLGMAVLTAAFLSAGFIGRNRFFVEAVGRMMLRGSSKGFAGVEPRVQ